MHFTISLKYVLKKYFIYSYFIHIIIFSFAIKTNAITFTPPFDIKSESAVLINLDTNSVIYEKNPISSKCLHNYQI